MVIVRHLTGYNDVKDLKPKAQCNEWRFWFFQPLARVSTTEGAASMNKASDSKSTPTKSFPSTPAGREQAFKQAQRQGEKSITFDLRKPTAKKP